MEKYIFGQHEAYVDNFVPTKCLHGALNKNRWVKRHKTLQVPALLCF